MSTSTAASFSSSQHQPLVPVSSSASGAVGNGSNTGGGGAVNKGMGNNNNNNNNNPSIVTSSGGVPSYFAAATSNVARNTFSSSLPSSSSATTAPSSSTSAASSSTSSFTPFWDYDQGPVLENWILRQTLPACFPEAVVMASPTTSSGSDPYDPTGDTTTTTSASALAATAAAARQYHRQRKARILPLFWQNLQTALGSIQLVPERTGQQQLDQEEGRGQGGIGENVIVSSSGIGPARKKAKTLASSRGASPTTAAHTSSNGNTRPSITNRTRTKWTLVDPYFVWKVTRKSSSSSSSSDAVGGGNGKNHNHHEPQQHVGNEPDVDDEEEEYDPSDLPGTWGGRLAQLSVGGLCNALALRHLMTQPHPVPPAKPTLTPPPAEVVGGLSTTTTTTMTPSWTMWELWHTAHNLHAAIQARVKQDILQMTPLRIQQMLAPECTPQEIAAIRKRIYDTVVLGKGLHQDEGLDDDPDGSSGLVTATSTGWVHDAEKYKKCPNCGNNDQSQFALDRKNGDIICSNCGVVVSESLMHEGSAYRKFEGESDRNHHGDAPNPLYSSGHNLSTGLSGTGGGGSHINGWNSMGAKGNMETILRNAHAYTELNVSQFGKNDRRTRTGYKDRQKKDAFVQMQHTGDALSLHEAVIQRAKELFAGFRDDRELVQQFKGVLAACLMEAFEQLSKEGRNLLKQQQQYEGGGGPTQPQQVADPATSASSTTGTTATGETGALPAPSVRATRRNELHHATLAGRGGLVIDFSNVSHKTKVPAVASRNRNEQPRATATGSSGNDAATPSGGVEDKATASWNLEDCRSWLLEASRRIAQQWIEERNTNPKSAIAKRFPATVSLEELEGQLVEYSIVLCEHLENEQQARNNKGALSHAGVTAGGRNQQRVHTPRVQDMSRLMIQWQHAHERGSGGKGGVGGSGHTNNPAGTSTGTPSGPARPPSSQQPQRSAGQILALQTAKKLGSIFSDPMAGEAFHKELRGVIGRQEARKRKELLEEATRQRLQQMKRKPWLQARIAE